MSTESTHETGQAYAAGQLAAALITAATHTDELTRQRAGQRVRRWQAVLDGMADGMLNVGSRTAVAGLPVWVTPEVVHGGFATGEAAAGGPLREHELAVIARAGLQQHSRGALFAYYLSEPGVAELAALLDSGGYRIDVPEEAALLTVAWLLRTGDHRAAADLVDTLLPFADRLRFWPVPADAPPGDPEIVWRETAQQAATALANRRPNAVIEAMREALTVWNPFADKLLALWCETTDADGRVGAQIPHGWPDRAGALLATYRRLAAEHTRCSKHRKPKENLGILCTALERRVADGALTPRVAGLLQHAVDSMLRRRGTVGSPQHQALRAQQAADAARPTHHAFAGLVAGRLSSLPPQTGIADVAGVLCAVQPGEAVHTGLPQDAVIPQPIQRVVRRARAGTPEELIGDGVICSAEVLAMLTPQVTAASVVFGYRDAALQRLAAAHYRAFRNRRSLLLLNLEHQVRIHELPWAGAMDRHRTVTAAAQQQAARALRRLGGIVLNGFPATVLPNPMITELAALSRQAGVDVPWVEELAADIFMGTFSAKFLEAAKIAAELLRGTFYERYYGIDYAAVAAINDDGRKRRRIVRTSSTFDLMCQDRAGGWGSGRYSVAANGMVIEQAQILTTHNLATLAGRLGAGPAESWEELARRCLDWTLRLATRIENNARPLRSVKDLAYAWRHMVFYLSLVAPAAQRRFIGEAQRAGVGRLLPALRGLEHVAGGGSFDDSGSAGDARRLVGWTVGRHWILAG
ncbi:hypothetical protein [Allorhizocola rhizosphaerae]|uniref:hypothetical protein n=1 Tax=Allorhizocola rhizosphaerae TaxID=1872709 RepID=UPI000E3BE7C6|nr:hypothetical protein [Allorhizocola rhizosphaerae]